MKMLLSVVTVVALASSPSPVPVPVPVPNPVPAVGRSASNATLTAVPGVKVGHFTLAERPTGCTVILTEAGAVASVDVRGGAPGTRETDLLDPVNHVQKVHA